MAKRNRAWRRAQFERIRSKVINYTRHKNQYFYRTEPHKFHAYNLDLPSELFEFMRLSPDDLKDGGKKRIWIDGKGYVNKPEPVYDSFFNYTYDPCYPFFNQDELDKEIMDRANHEANNRAICSCPTCGNQRNHYNELSMQEKKAPRIEDFE